MAQEICIRKDCNAPATDAVRWICGEGFDLSGEPNRCEAHARAFVEFVEDMQHA